MRILIHGLNFAPELVGTGKLTGEMAEWLAARGHAVRAVTAPPFNPVSKIAPGFSAWRYQREDRFFSDPSSRHPSSHPSPRATGTSEPGNIGAGGQAGNARAGSGGGRLSVFRCPIWVPRSPSAGKRILHLGSFAFSSFWSMLRQVPWRPDVVVVIAPTLLCAPNARITAGLSGAKSWFHVQDFEADAAFDLGLLTSSGLRRLVLGAEAACMRGFGRVSTISEKMLLRLAEKGVEPSRCVLFPNWVDANVIFPLPHPSALRSELGIEPGAIVALYTGTMAYKQGLEVLTESAGKLASRSELHFVFCGEGSGKAAVAERTAGMKTVHWLPLQPLDRLNDLFNLADIHLLPQRANAADLVMPSKLTSMLASGRPVVAGASGGTQLAEVVENRGIVVPPENSPAFAEAIDRLASHPELREKLGRNARNYAVSNLEKNAVLERFEQELLKFVAEGPGNRTISN